MDAWAASTSYGGGKVNFVCVGCAGPGLAKQFVADLQLRHCVVGYAREAEQPRWGQLGCNGFIVLDKDKRVVSRATSPFLQMRGLAFLHVEALLDALLAGSAVPAICPAQVVALDGVSDAKKRGQRGVALDATDRDNRSTVFLLSGSGGGSMVRVASDKLRVLPSDAVQISPGQLEALEKAREVVVATKHPDEAPARTPRSFGGESGQVRKRKAPPKPSGDTQGDEAAEPAEAGPVRVESVLNAELDRQHEECASALEALATQRSATTLDAALRVIRRHFDYEEGLLDEHLYPGLAGGGAPGGGGFSTDASMRKSHYADHARILSTIEEKLAALRGPGDAAAGGSCGPGKSGG